jgi:hypothetical protein
MVAMANGVKVEPAAAVPDNTAAAANGKADSPISVLGDEVIYSYKTAISRSIRGFSVVFLWGRFLYFVQAL